jgi:phenylpropionate dioxygenase-like ring-hydroxylating dioxygenase large terminal subunit
MVDATTTVALRREPPSIAGMIQRDRIHRAIYTDPAIFDLEMRRIFERSWVYLGHGSEIKEAGDYKTTMIGRHPVIVSRLSDGSICALINRCRHRGATVCQYETGNSRFFRCAYHGWTYRNDGALVGVPYPSGYGTNFDRGAMALTAIARVASHRGFIFGCMAAEGPSLDEHLGGARALLDEFCDVSPTGEIDVFKGLQKCSYRGNWKYQLENGVDPYHVQFLHQSTFDEQSLKIYRETVGAVVDLDGHGMTDHRDMGPMPPDGSLKGGFNLVVFPNLVVLRTQIRTIRPIAVDRTEIISNVVRLENVPEELNQRRLRSQEFEFGSAGVVYVDDLEIFERSQEGLQSRADDWLIFARGLERESMRNGYLSASMTDETQHRGMYRRWNELMTQTEGECGA